MSCINKSLPSSFHCNAPSPMPFNRYEPWCEFEHGLPFDTKWPERKWPTQRLVRAPRWCSVDLRDGNQALVNPMDVTKKIRYFRTLLAMGFKEIEIGFPSASQLDFDFTRLLIEQENLPDDVWLMVLVQARDHLIKKTIEALEGAKNVIIHLYNSTSELQRRVVFNLPKDEIKAMAVKGTALIRSLSDQTLKASGCNVRFEYSPESFTGTEVHFALEICHAVMDAWGPTKENPIIFNLPETVQNAGPHFYADQIEWMHTHFKDRQKILISLHPHNDRGTGVASAELAMQAGADRVEGCLFGNGERTGNVCLITLAVNFMHHGMDPELDLSNLPAVVEMFQECTGMLVPERHPWVGSLVYTAFSGSHQDAIKKGLEAMKKKQQLTSSATSGKKSKQQQQPSSSVVMWEVPYLPIDPKDLGRSYEAIVRINSQSGKGGVAFIMESEFGITLPRGMQIEFSQSVQAWCDQTAKEVDPKKVYEIFRDCFLELKTPVALRSYKLLTSPFEGSSLESIGKDSPLCSGANGHKRTRTATTPGGSDPALSPKRRDLGKLNTHHATNATTVSHDESAADITTTIAPPSRVTTATSTTGSSSEFPDALKAPIHTPNGDDVKGVGDSCPSSEWLVVDRPLLTDDNLAKTAQPSQPRPPSPLSSQTETDRILINAGLSFKGPSTTNGTSAAETSSTPIDFSGVGNGPIDAFLVGFNQLNASTSSLFNCGLVDFEIQDFQEMAIGKGSSAEAICFIELKATMIRNDGKTSSATNGSQSQQTTAAPRKVKCWGAARHTNTTTAGLSAICSAINRLVSIHQCSASE